MRRNTIKETTMKEELIKDIHLALEQLSKANCAMIDVIVNAVNSTEEKSIEFDGPVLPDINGNLLLDKDDYGMVMVYDKGWGEIEEYSALEDLTSNELFDICSEILRINEK